MGTIIYTCNKMPPASKKAKVTHDDKEKVLIDLVHRSLKSKLIDFEEKLENGLRFKESYKKSHDEEMKRLKEKIDSMQEKMKNQESKIDSLTKENKILISKSNEKCKDCEEKHKELEEMKNKDNKRLEQIFKRQTKLKQYKEILETRDKSIMELKDENDELKEEVDALKEQLSSKTISPGKNDDMKKEKEELKIQLSEANAAARKIEILQKENESLKQQLLESKKENLPKSTATKTKQNCLSESPSYNYKSSNLLNLMDEFTSSLSSGKVIEQEVNRNDQMETSKPKKTSSQRKRPQRKRNP